MLPLDSFAVDSLAVAADEVVPVVKVFALVDQAVGAGLRQPVDGGHDFGRQLDADRHELLAVWVVLALAGLVVEQLAVKFRHVEVAGGFVFELHQAAFAAAVAEGFPLRIGHFVELLGFPKGLSGHGAGIGGFGSGRTCGYFVPNMRSPASPRPGTM